MPSGTVMKGIGGFYYVKSGNKVYACRAKGIFRKRGITPLPGDRVEFSVTHEGEKEGFLEEIHQRTACLKRPAVSNVTMLLTVVSTHAPEPELELLDKLLVSAGLEGIGALICVNKIDIDNGKVLAGIKEEYGPAGFRIIAASGLTGVGMDELREVLGGSITVFAGQSGVGKSTLINAITGRKAMDTGELSKKGGKGRHTTRHAQLIDVQKDGYVVDTPGFSSFDLTGIDPEVLKEYYPEFRNVASVCRFKGCNHITEPGCGIMDAVEKGRIGTGRYARYMELYKKLEWDRRHIYD